jgi:hypothetical protein
MCPDKEPTFFCEGFQVVKNPIKYFELFDSVKAESAIGEASHAYLTNPSTAKVLKALFPGAKFIVILRNPADRAYSLYHHMRRHGYESAATFEKALQLEDKRVHSKRFQDKCPQYYYNYLYFRSGLYGEQIERYFSLFDENRFHILTLEELKIDPAASLLAIVKFLELNTDFKPIIQVHNKSLRTARVPLIHYIWRSKVRPSRVPGKFIFRMLEKINFKEIPPMSTEFRKALLTRYESDLRRLYQLTGIRFRSREESEYIAAVGEGEQKFTD